MLVSKGFSFTGIERYPDAITCLYKALELKPYFPKAWELLSATLLDLQRYEEAAQHYQIAEILHSLNRDDEAFRYYYEAIYSWEEVGVCENILACYDKAIDIRPEDSELWINRGETLYNFGKYQEALESYEQSLELDSDNDNIWYLRGNVLLDLDKYEEAITSYDKSL